MISREKMNLADFETFIALPENADKHFELIDGDLYEMTPTSELPTVIGIEIATICVYLHVSMV
jgi:Uma2 family endonuclease